MLKNFAALILLPALAFGAIVIQPPSTGGGGGPDATSIARDGSRPPTANQPWGAFKITGLADPTLAQDAATKAYVDAAASGLTSINADSTAAQTIAVGSAGADFAIVDGGGGVHTLNLPTASAVNTGKLSSADWSIFNAKEPAIASGTTLQYWRGDKTFQTLNTTVVPEGTNLYYTTTRFNSDLSTKTTTDLTEGVNLYFTDERVDDRAAALIQNGTGLSWVYVDGAGTLTGNVSLSSFSTSDLTEGTNLYFTDERAQDGVGGILTDTSSVDFTYSDAGNTVSAVVLPAGVDHNSLSNLATGDVHTQYALSNSLRSNQVPTTQSGTTYTVATNDVFIRIDTTSNVIAVTLPDPSTRRKLTIKDVGGNLSVNALTVVRFGSEKIENLAASKVFSSNFGAWTLQSDGTDWWLL